MTTKELQENVLSTRKNLYNGRTYFYLFFDKDRQIGFPIIFNNIERTLIIVMFIVNDNNNNSSNSNNTLTY